MAAASNVRQFEEGKPLADGVSEEVIVMEQKYGASVTVPVRRAGGR